MAVYDNTALEATIDEKWSSKVHEGRYAKSVVLPRVLNESNLVKQSGDIVHLTYEGELTTSDVTAATGAFTPVTASLTSVPITLNQWKIVPIEIVDKAKDQSLYSPESTFPDRAGKAFGAKFDTDLLSLYGSFTDNIPWKTAGDPTLFDDTAMNYAMLKLADQDIPKDEISWFLPPIAFYKGIATKPEFTDASKIGLPKSVLTTGFRFPLMGVPAYETTTSPTADQARVGILSHKTAMAIAMNKKTEFERVRNTAAGRLSTTVLSNTIYGFSAFRTDHAVVVYILKA